jgi:hypothetical protein
MRDSDGGVIYNLQQLFRLNLWLDICIYGSEVILGYPEFNFLTMLSENTHEAALNPQTARRVQ